MRSSGAPVSGAAGCRRRCAPRRPLNAIVRSLWSMHSPDWGDTQMRVIVLAFAMLAGCTSSFAAPKEDAEAAYAQFFSSFRAANQEQIVSLFTPEALFYGTSSVDLVTTAQGIHDYFTRALSGPA